MTQKETEDVNVALEWVEQANRDNKKRKRDKVIEDENRATESIWQNRSTISKGTTRAYRRNYDDIDWSK